MRADDREAGRDFRAYRRATQSAFDSPLTVVAGVWPGRRNAIHQIILFSGGAGSGKTSTAEAWAASRAGLAAHLSHDTIHGFVRSGFVSAADNPGAEADRQWHVALEVCVVASRVYVAAGIRCAIDSFLLPSSLSLWEGLRDLRVGVVVLHPDVEVAVRRNASRIGWGVPEWQVRANHRAMRVWSMRPDVLVVDNTEMEMRQVLAMVDAWDDVGAPRLQWPDATSQ